MGSTTFQVTVTTTGTTASPTTDSATITGNEYDPNMANNSATVSVPVTAVSDLQIGMTAAPNPVYVGNVLTYTITASNAGPSTEPAAVVTDTLARQRDGPVGHHVDRGHAVRLGQRGDGQPGHSGRRGTPVTITITVIPQRRGVPPARSSTPPQISGQNVDNNMANNTATATTTVVPSADLAVKVARHPRPVWSVRTWFTRSRQPTTAHRLPPV